MPCGEAPGHASYPDPGIQDQPLGRMDQKRSRWEMYFCVSLTGREKKDYFRCIKQGEKWLLLSDPSLGAGKGQALLIVLPIELGVRKTRECFFIVVVPQWSFKVFVILALLIFVKFFPRH